MAVCTAIKGRDLDIVKSKPYTRLYLRYHVHFIYLGRFCLSLLAFLVGLGKILLWATKTTCFPENFFSSSLTNLIMGDRFEHSFDHLYIKGPGLDLLEGLQLRDWDKDYDGLLAPGALHLVSKADWDRAKCR